MLIAICQHIRIFLHLYILTHICIISRLLNIHYMCYILYGRSRILILFRLCSELFLNNLQKCIIDDLSSNSAISDNNSSLHALPF